jgi:hypothetical protein
MQKYFNHPLDIVYRLIYNGIIQGGAVMYNTTIKASMIQPVHEVKDADKFNIIKSSMEQNGWQGRPLLVVDMVDYYQAFTGSHRLAAAQEAGIEEIPVAVVDLNQMCEDYEMTVDDLLSDIEFTYYTLKKEYDQEAAELLYEDI